MVWDSLGGLSVAVADVLQSVPIRKAAEPLDHEPLPEKVHMNVHNRSLGTQVIWTPMGQTEQNTKSLDEVQTSDKSAGIREVCA